MAFGKNGSVSDETAPPKKADIILKANQEISSKQDEILRQTKLSNSRMDATIEMFSKNMQDMAFLAKQSSEIFSRIQSENSALKQELLYLAKQNENIYSGLAEQIAELSARLDRISSGSPARSSTSAAEIDYDKLAEKVAALIGVRDDVSPDYIASKVAEQIVIPEQSAAVDEEKLASRVAELVGGTSPALVFDEEELADAIALKTGSLKSEDFEILVDDEGCASISKEIAEKLDYDFISGAISEKLRPETESEELDCDELAARLGEKLKISNINEDAIADKAAAILSNYLPELDADEIADKVAASVIEVLLARIEPSADSEAISEAVSEKIIAAQEDGGYEIVLDDEGIKQIVGSVSEEIDKATCARLEKVETDVAEIRRLLESGVPVKGGGEIAAAEAVYDDTLVTVSDIVPEEEEDGDGEEQPEDAMPEVLSENTGVDFANMMKYNRSFIARIIQSSDDQKRYYGAVKHALLSYKKVNSNVAWGAERFNKGRETIARMRIRGKTLCLYLALDPNEYKTSVYHHADVSSNKSMSGTPMMVKVKSPLGVKKAVRLIDEMLAKRDGIKKEIPERDYAAMYPYETIEQLIEDGLVKDVSKNN